MARSLDEVLTLSPVMPIVVIDDAGDAPDLARALQAGGVQVVEVTMRTPAALDAIKAIRKAAPDMAVGAGTVLTSRHVGQAADAGAQFLVTPGITNSLMTAMQMLRLPYIPGAVTASEVMALLGAGVGHMKFFPAEQAGGAAWLKAIHGPLPDAVFCPTGGITRETAPDYLALPNVPCVGGSWVAPAKAIAAKDWSAIEENARAAMALRG